MDKLYRGSNPMTTLSDIIVAGANGKPTRMAKGSNSRVFGVDASGSLGYRQLVAGDIPSGLITSSMHAAIPIIRLSYNAVSNVYSTAALAAGAYDLIAPQNFTVGAAGSICAISSFGAAAVSSSTGNISEIYMYIDSGSGGTYYLVSRYGIAATQDLSWAGVVFQSLTAGTHTVQIQLVLAASSTVSFDPATTAARSGRIFVVEIP